MKNSKILLAATLTTAIFSGVSNVSAATTEEVTTWEGLKSCLASTDKVCKIMNSITGNENII